jgi:large subunit ribosomal protein L35
MPKMKSNRAAKKRFKITGTGRVRRSKGNAQHNMNGKSRKRLRRLRNNDMVSPELEKRVKIMLPYG